MTIWRWIFAAVFLLSTQAMAQSGPAPASAAGHAAMSRDGETKGWIVGEPVAGSTFARVEIGMVPTQVYRLLGAPDKVIAYPTGKGFIPFYFGADAARTEWRYKGQGGIAFVGTGKLGAVIVITYDKDMDMTAD